MAVSQLKKINWIIFERTEQIMPKQSGKLCEALQVQQKIKNDNFQVWKPKIM